MAKITKMLMALERFCSPLRPPSTTPIENPAPQNRHKQWQSRSSYKSATAVAVLAVKIATNIFAAATNSLPVQIQKHHLLQYPVAPCTTPFTRCSALSRCSAVCPPSWTTTCLSISPLIRLCSIPAANRLGFSKVAVARTVSGSGAACVQRSLGLASGHVSARPYPKAPMPNAPKAPKAPKVGGEP